MNWAFKIAAKIVLSRLPVDYNAWRKLGYFKHGSMNDAAYVQRIFNLHTCRTYPGESIEGRVLLELGPGDSVASAIIATSMRVQKIYLVDVGDYVHKGVEFYKQMALDLGKVGENAVDLSAAKTFEDVLTACNAEYLTDGLRSLQKLEDNSVDLVWSHSVVEHIEKSIFRSLFDELYRVMKPGAFASHNIDLKDHLGGGLNNLRFSEKVWESNLFSKSGFYTNRIPAVRIHKIVQESGFQMIFEEFGKWESLPTPRTKLDKSFQKFSDDELRCRTSSLVVQKPPQAQSEFNPPISTPL